MEATSGGEARRAASATVGWRLTALVAVAAFGFALAVLLLQLQLLGLGASPFAQMTSPLAPSSDPRNPYFGYLMLVDDGGLFREVGLHRENLPPILLARKMLGGESGLSIYDGRVLFPALAATLAPLAGTILALLLTNAALWAAAIAAVFRLAASAGGDLRAGVLAAILCSFGLGYWLHLLDLSAHTAAFASYAIAACVLFESGVWRERKPWRIHAGIACVLALCCASYNSGLMLVAVYAVVALVGRNSPVVVLPAAIGPVVFQYAWLGVLRLTGLDPSPISLTEQHYLGASLQRWGEILQSGPEKALETAGVTALQFIAVEPALLACLVVLGGLALLLRVRLSWRVAAFFACLFLAPTALSLPWSQFATARGYLGFPAEVAVYVGLACACIGLWRSNRTLGIIAGSLIGVAVVAQAAMLGTVLAGGLAPAKAFLAGDLTNYATRLFNSEQPLRLALVGASPPPVDTGNWLAASHYTEIDLPPHWSGAPRALLWRLYLAAPALALALLWRGSLRLPRRAALLGIVLAIVAPVLLVQLTPKEHIRIAGFDNAVDASTTQTLRLAYLLPTDVAAAIRQLGEQGGRLEIIVGTSYQATTTVRLAGLPAEGAAMQFKVSSSAASRVRPGDSIEVEIASPAPLGRLTGYRPAGDGDRTSPMLELRGYLPGSDWPVLLIY